MAENKLAEMLPIVVGIANFLDTQINLDLGMFCKDMKTAIHCINHF